jgi:peptidoglycan/LPS O-acetylase OafA/YrhL
VCAVCRKSKNVLFTLIALVSVLLLNNEITFGFEPLLRCLAGFFIGCLTSLATNRLKISVPRYASLLFLFAIILFLQLKTTKQYEISIYFLTAALIASIVLSKNGYLNSILKFKTLTWLGAISYSLYMSHGAIVWVSNQIMRVALKKPEIMIRGISIPQLDKTETLIACVALTVVVFVISVSVYRFVEKPMREKSRRFAFSKLG